MLNWLGLLLLILVVIIAWRLWAVSYNGGMIIGGGKKDAKSDDEESDTEDLKEHKETKTKETKAKETKETKESSASYKEFQSYTITEDGHFVRASFNDNGGKQSILVLYNNGSRDKDGKITQGEIQIAFKIEDGKLDKENVKLQNIEKLDDHGREVITKALVSLKNRMDDATTKAIKATLEWISL
jgi:Sec-independent protein translocase protein TatA